MFRTDPMYGMDKWYVFSHNLYAEKSMSTGQMYLTQEAMCVCHLAEGQRGREIHSGSASIVNLISLTVLFKIIFRE